MVGEPSSVPSSSRSWAVPIQHGSAKWSQIAADDAVRNRVHVVARRVDAMKVGSRRRRQRVCLGSLCSKGTTVAERPSTGCGLPEAKSEREREGRERAGEWRD